MTDAIPPAASPDFTEVERRYRQAMIERYNRLDFSGFGTADLFLTDVVLESIFVRLNLSVEKVIREPVPLEDQEDAEPGRGLQGKQAREGPSRERQRERVVLVQEPIGLADALKEHLLIVGEPGAGKSALVRWLAVTFAQGCQRQPDRLGPSADADRLPILVELGRLPDRYLQPESHEAPPWNQFLPQYVAGQDAFADTPREFLHRALADGRCLLLFDGLDEIADPAARRRIAGSLAELARLHPGNRLVICSRPAAVGESEGALRPLFRRTQIQRFTPDDVQRFFRFWYTQDPALTPEQQRQGADVLFAQVQAAPKVLELATTPLLSTILLLIWRNTGRLPERRVELYEQCCRVLIEHWEAHHDVACPGALADLGWERHLRLLAPLAYTIHSQEKRTDAGRAELVPALARGLQEEGLCTDPRAATLEAERFLRTLALRSGLLQHLGGDRYGFPHLTFQEYLAGRHIAGQPDPDDTIDLVMAHLHEAWWREVHLLAIGHLGSGGDGTARASALLLTILNLYRPAPLLLRSASLKAGRPRWLVTFEARWQHHRVLSRLAPGLAFAVSAPRSARRLFARQFPGWHLGPRLAWMLAREFELAARGYGDCTPPGTTEAARRDLREAAAALLLRIVRDPGRQKEKSNLLAAVCCLLAGQAGPEVVAALVHALGDELSFVRWTAAKSLGRLGQASPEVVASLARALGDWDSAVQQAAVESLGQLGQASPEVVAGLVRALGDEDIALRQAAAESLGRLGQAEPEAVVAVLVRALGDGGWFVRQGAAESLRQLGQARPEVVAGLVRALRDEDWRVPQAAAESLWQWGQREPEVVAVLVRALGDEDWRVQRAAAESLGRLGKAEPEAIVAGLVRALRDEDWSVRQGAAISLGQLGQARPEAVAGLVRALYDEVWSVRWVAAISLGQLGQAEPEVVAGLVHALRDEDWRVQRAAAVSLAQLKQAEPEAVAGLVRALGYWNSAVREAVAASLGQVGQAGPEVVAGQVRALGDEEPFVRRAAAKGLGRFGRAGPEVVAGLVRALGDEDRFVRQAATASLWQWGQAEPEAAAGLVRALDDEDLIVREAAVASLGQLGQARPEVVNALVRALDEDSPVRRAAAASLGQLGQAGPEAVAGLIRALSDEAGEVREAAAESLSQLKVEEEGELRKLLAALNRALHDTDDDVRRAALASIRTLLDGRPIPGYRWTPLRVRHARARRWKQAGFWTLIVAGVLLIVLLGAWLLTNADPNSFVVRFLSGLAVLLGALGAIAQILGRALRDPWDKTR